MKRFLLLTTIIILLSQAGKTQNFEIGPRAGVNFNPVLFDTLHAQLLNTDWSLGLYSSYKFNNWFSLRPEVYYLSKQKSFALLEKSNFLQSLNDMMKGLGGSLNQIPGSNNLNIDSIITSIKGYVNDTVYSRTRGNVSLSYLELPIIANFHYRSFSFGIGPYIGILTGAHTRTELKQDIPLLTSFPGLIKEAQKALDSLSGGFSFLKIEQLIGMSYPGYYKPMYDESSSTGSFTAFDYGLVLNFGFRIDNNWEFGIRYTHGFTNYRTKPLRDADVNKTIHFVLSFNIFKAFQKPPKF